MTLILTIIHGLSIYPNLLYLPFIREMLIFLQIPKWEKPNLERRGNSTEKASDLTPDALKIKYNWSVNLLPLNKHRHVYVNLALKANSYLKST